MSRYPTIIKSPRARLNGGEGFLWRSKRMCLLEFYYEFLC